MLCMVNVHAMGSDFFDKWVITRWNGVGFQQKVLPNNLIKL